MMFIDIVLKRFICEIYFILSYSILFLKMCLYDMENGFFYILVGVYIGIFFLEGNLVLLN